MDDDDDGLGGSGVASSVPALGAKSTCRSHTLPTPTFTTDTQYTLILILTLMHFLRLARIGGNSMLNRVSAALTGRVAANEGKGGPLALPKPGAIPASPPKVVNAGDDGFAHPEYGGGFIKVTLTSRVCLPPAWLVPSSYANTLLYPLPHTHIHTQTPAPIHTYSFAPCTLLTVFSPTHPPSHVDFQFLGTDDVDDAADEDISFKKKGSAPNSTPQPPPARRGGLGGGDDDDGGPAGPPPTNRPVIVPKGRRRSSIEDDVFFFGEEYAQVPNVSDLVTDSIQTHPLTLSLLPRLILCPMMHPQEQALTFDEEAGVTPDDDKDREPQDNAKKQEKVIAQYPSFTALLLATAHPSTSSYLNPAPFLFRYSRSWLIQSRRPNGEEVPW
jgi:hypothetical protein